MQELLIVYHQTQPHHVRVTYKDVRHLYMRFDRAQGIAITAPRTVSPERLLAFANQNIARFAAHAAKSEASERFAPEKGAVYVFGVRFAVKPVRSNRATRIETVNGVLYVHAPALTAATLRAAVEKHLVALGRPFFAERLAALAPRVGVRDFGLRVGWAEGKWGSYDPRKREVFLAGRLACCPPEVIDYVVLHELCHATHNNHSAAFWSMVASFCPDYKRIRALLREGEV